MTKIIQDELGRIITLSSGNEEERMKGIECYKTNALIVQNIANFLNTSFGPFGSDKIMQDLDGNVTITNDGATILKNMDLDSPIAKLILDLSESMDDEIGDGTTSVVIIASALLKNTVELLYKKIHPVIISEAYDKALKLLIEHLNNISEKNKKTNEVLINAAKTSLNSKIVNKSLDLFADICTKAVKQVFDERRKDVDLERIRIEARIGNDISQTKLLNGVILNKEFSHSQMVKSIENAKIAILTCPFEPPKIKTKHSLNISTVEDYKNLAKYEKSKFIEMIARLKEVGANIVVCQWGFDDEANSLLMEHNLPAIRWVGGAEIEQIAVHTGGSIISRFEDLSEQDLGSANVSEITIGTEDEKIINIENKNSSHMVTIYVRGATDMVIEESKRSIRDALCSVRNILINDKIIYGGGSSEISSSLFLRERAKILPAEESECFNIVAQSLEEIPFCLARNIGVDAIEYLGALRTRQANENSHTIGVCINSKHGVCMKNYNIFDAFHSKVKQYSMAIQLVNTILKIDDMIVCSNDI
ncbi:T-complex protein 1, epsilon subunit [Edhazardia aedis USNM 41457]|uniref:T-complex protein 1, epsilon subunit n=1 Tax=Edhazardia aedis (strain USNM 41457) TaxID=1003232 RepID=J9DV88_EDHAE|nr:T-complex protein 1, epsilon subunit [Edhazardia aedis USNM 41457]|eukprot:EJW05207.1 T-complex protein 1, epsilon subunit [Edhazardia aedis USNM 41457]